MKPVLLVVALVLIASSLLPFVRSERWWIRIFDFPRVQILVLNLFVLGGIALFAEVTRFPWIVIAVLLAATTVLEGARIFPYTAIAPKEVLTAKTVAAERAISLVVANVLMTNRNAERFIEIVRDADPDIVLTLEPDNWWEKQLDVFSDTHVHTVRVPLANTYGMLLQSRLPLENPEIRYLIRTEIPSIHTNVRLRSGESIRLHCVHPEPPSPTEADESTPRDAELIVVGRHVKEHGSPAIVAGDLNDVAWSHTTSLFQKVSGLLDPRKGRGLFSTFHARIPPLRWPLDHIFHSDHFTLAEIERLPSFGSDHFPVYARLLYEPRAQAEQQAPEADSGDRADAADKVARASGQGRQMHKQLPGMYPIFENARTCSLPVGVRVHGCS